MKKRNSLLLCAGLAVLLNSSVFAANRPGAITVNLSDAYYHFSQGRYLKNTQLPNIALTYDIDDRWAAELGVGIINTDPTAGANNDNRGVHGQLYTLDGIYRFSRHGVFDPYVIAGIGILGLKPISNDTQHQANVNAGLGTQIFFGNDVALRGEVRDIYTTTGSAKNDYMINIGVSILFGGERPVPVSQPVAATCGYKGECPIQQEKK